MVDKTRNIQGNIREKNVVMNYELWLLYLKTIQFNLFCVMKPRLRKDLYNIIVVVAGMGNGGSIKLEKLQLKVESLKQMLNRGKNII